MQSSRWKTSGFKEVDFFQCAASGSIFDECDFSDSAWVRSKLRHSTFHNCLLGGASFTNIDWRDSLLYQTNLRKIKATKVDFRQSILREVDTEHGVFVQCRTNQLEHTPPAKHPIPEMQK
jgi:uncharacterized protein YjbI with pentapeptide repeats